MNQQIATLTGTTPIQKAFDQFQTKKGLTIKLDDRFHNQLGIAQLRFWKLRTGRVQPRPSELKALSAFLECEIKDLI
ncbi:hypothetical protein BWI97_18350 [Siphonobacter sp. BAB-5405]|uniref:hypothetical protein n=1 Tax=Siphonobacter sp. BAB-5405 TaxID=1864825 RepID=UPI000C7F9CD6|nr:hypothetical protein [Siphonobacter sp. BAB-5405]PMD93554.1 hypothetical protein BWI97_18350 [Siphonobacter sp. BAB-5405]